MIDKDTSTIFKELIVIRDRLDVVIENLEIELSGRELKKEKSYEWGGILEK